MRASCLFFLLAPLGAGCSDEPSPFPREDANVALDATQLDAGDAEAPDVTEPVDRPPIPIRDTGGASDMVLVYAHSDTTLYTVDPRNNNRVTTVGNFMFPRDGQNHTMTDIAVDAEANLVGVTHDALYSIDPTNARCTLVHDLPDGHIFVGLTWLPRGALDANAEVLVGGATDGTLWRINPDTGRASSAGRLSTGWGVSGDIVSIEGAGTFVTIRRTTGSSTTDTLATWDPRTGRTTHLGEVGFPSLYGLGYWRSTLYGFTRAGAMISVNVRTGRGTRLSMPTMEFSGAGVTTVAPVAPP